MTMAIILMVLSALASPVNPHEATRAARAFWSATLQARNADSLELQRWPYENVYLFTLPHSGWVMVAAEDCARPVLAFSVSGSFNPQKMPAAMRNFLYVYEQEIREIRRSDIGIRDSEWDVLLAGGALKSLEEIEVGPLLSTQWFQMSPYNMYCPGNTMTGCVATAMAQVMKYWDYPAFGKGSHSYTDDSGYGTQSADFGDTRYDWANMPNTLTGASPAAAKAAVATLMYHCGVSVNMHYSTVNSGTTMNKCAVALPTYFRYNSQDIRYRGKGQLSNAAWTDTLIAELNAHRPILYGGNGPAGGHTFVCDGYNAQRYLHFNLGEAGEGDGYYAIGAINYGMYSFNQENDAILGIHPEYGVYTSVETVSFSRHGGQKQVWLSTCDTSDATLTTTGGADWFTVNGTDVSHLGQLTITADVNNTGSERSGSVVFSQGGHTAILNILQEPYDPDMDYCPLTVVMENTHNGPWAGDAHLSFESPTGTVYGIAQHTANSGSSTTTVHVAPHDVMVRWHPGGALDRYINYKVIGQNGDVFVEVNNAYFEGEDALIVWPCSHVGIDERTDGDDGWNVWPNPTTGIVYVNRNPSIQPMVELIDAAGRVLMRSDDTTMDISRLKAGVYYLRLVSENGGNVKKVIKY